MRATHARRLTSARLEVVSDQRARRVLQVFAVVALVAIAGFEGARLMNDGSSAAGRRDELERSSAALRSQVAGLQAELQLERATHAALDRQVADLGRQVAELERQLAFVSAQKKRTQATTNPN